MLPATTATRLAVVATRRRYAPAVDRDPERREEGHDPFPDPRPFRRIQAATAALIAVAAVVTLLSGERPAAVRWGAAVGIGVLILIIWVITRSRGPRGR
jgi:hypothetical protein